MCDIFIESIAYRAMHAFHVRTFQVGFTAHLEENAISVVPEHVLKMFIKSFLALISAHTYGIIC